MTRRITERLTDLSLAVACALAMTSELRISDEPRTEVTPYAVATIVIAVLPLLAHRRWPGWALVAAMAALYLVMAVSAIHQTVPLPSMITGFFLATQLDRKRAILAGVALTPFVLLALVLFSDEGLLTFETAKNLAFVALPLCLGIAVRERRASVAALVERAESAERTREEEALRRVSEERLRIARDVHDVVAHAMVAINVQAGVAAHLLDRDTEQARHTLLDIKRVSGEALGDLRSTLGVLRSADGQDDAPAPVAPASGVRDLGDLRESLRGSGVDVALDIDPAVDALPAMVGTTSFRIVQEALTNVLRHASSSAARVSVRREGDVVVIDVTDDGAGERATVVTPGTGNGVRGMQERASALGGDLVAGPQDGGGWRVHATLPAGQPA